MSGAAPPFDFTDRVVLVVGGSSGIGNGIAQAFRASGAKVHIWGTRPRAEDYDGVAGSDLNGLHYACVDVMQGEAVAKAGSRFDRLDVLVLSQGGPMHDGAEFELPNFEKVLDLNLSSVMRCATQFEALLAQSLGTVVIVGSVAAFDRNVSSPAYASAKAGIARLTQVLGGAWAAKRIRVNSVAPGLVLTKIAKSTHDPALQAKAREMIPLGRPGTPQDMAAAALFLASPLASYITGQTLIVDGGLSL